MTIDLDAPVYGRNLDTASFKFDEERNLITIPLDAATLARDGEGNLRVTGLPDNVVQAILAQVPAAEGGGPFATGKGGFDQVTEILTLNKSDGTQEPIGMPGIVTKVYLESAGSAPMNDVFGQPGPQRILAAQ